jgi:hypothetical protein
MAAALAVFLAPSASITTASKNDENRLMVTPKKIHPPFAGRVY